MSVDLNAPRLKGSYKNGITIDSIDDSDHHTGVNMVPEGHVLEVEKNRQMFVLGGVTIGGEVIVKGEMICE